MKKCPFFPTSLERIEIKTKHEIILFIFYFRDWKSVHHHGTAQQGIPHTDKTSLDRFKWDP